jgi:murein DD-endopeptidase MepM/ murein hydrolase activator NlpD
MAFIIVASGPVTTSRMRTFSAGRLLACGAAAAVALMGACLALGYYLARHDPLSAGIHDGPETREPELVVVDRIGELTGRLMRLEIEAASLARRLGVLAPDQDTEQDRQAVNARQETDDSPRGGPFMPLGDETSTRAMSSGDVDQLEQLEGDIDLLQASLERIAGVLADRELTTMAYPNRLPVQGVPRVSSGFGVRHDPFTGRLARHMGLDIPAAHGTAIMASGGGRVTFAGRRGPYGKAVVIDHGDGLQTLYGHCSKLYVRTGDLVMPQQRIADVGSTGRSTGPHLHFEVIRDGKRVAPGQVLNSVLARNAP